MIFAFGGHERDEQRLELDRGWQVALQPRVLALLLCLVRNREGVVSKAEPLEPRGPTRSSPKFLGRALSLATCAP